MKLPCLIAPTLAVFFTMVLTSCQTLQPDPAKGLKPSDLCKLGDSSAREKALAEHGLLLQLKKGDTLPVKIAVTGNVLNLPSPQTVKMRVQSDCIVFVHPKSGALQLSFDGKHFMAVKKAITGRLDLKISQTEGQQATANVSLEAESVHQRLKTK